MATKERPRYITTLSGGGLLVAIPTNGKRALTKTFRPIGSELEAQILERATKWRDRAWMRLYGEVVPARSFHTNARESSATGIPGVRVITKRVKKGKKAYIVPCVIAEVATIAGENYKRPTGWISRLYSLNKYELEEAVALARAWREEQIRIYCGRSGKQEVEEG